MTDPTPAPPEAVRRAVEQAFYLESGRILGALMRLAGDLQEAEDALQDAVAAALGTWPVSGVPANPGAWLLTTARNRLLDRLRRQQVQVRKLAALALADPEPASPAESGEDDVVALLFTCCHPALTVETRLALTLRAVLGLTTAQIARAFLTTEATIAQRLVRGKRKIKLAGIPFRVPPPHLRAERLADVLAAVYLLFNAGHSAGDSADLLRPDLLGEAIRLARLVHTGLPGEPEAAGLLALLLLTHARSGARLHPDGTLAPLEEQDRSRWNAGLIAEGTALLDHTLAQRRPGPYQLQAAIAALHDAAPTWDGTDWRQITLLYGELLLLQPTPVVALNRAVAVGFSEGFDAGLRLLDAMAAEPSLRNYHLLPAAEADMLRRLHRWDAAADAYHRAIELCTNAVERAYLARRLREVTGRR